MHVPAHDLPRDPFAGLRGILALWIFSGHLLMHERYAGIYDAGFARHEDFGMLGPLILLRFLGVDIFFMLSGLVLTLHYGHRFTLETTGRAIDKFYWRRIMRLWPMHAAMIAVIGLYQYIGILHPISSHIEDQIFAHWQWTLGINLVMMNGWGIIPVSSWDEPAWSVSILFFLSILFPNLLLILKRLPAKPFLYVIGIAICILGFALLRPFIEGGYSDGAGALVRGIAFFTSGCLLALYINTGGPKIPCAGSWVPLVFMIAVLIWTYLFQFPLTIFHLLYPFLLLTLFHGIHPIIPPKIGQWLGSRSFALCMSHYPTLLAIRYFLGSHLAQWAGSTTLAKIGCYCFVIATVLLVSEIAYQLFDRPRRVIRG